MTSLKTGDIIELIDQIYGFRFKFIVDIKNSFSDERRSSITITLAYPNQPYSRLTIMQSNQVHFSDNGSLGNLKGSLLAMEFIVQQVKSRVILVRLFSATSKPDSKGRRLSLGVNKEGEWIVEYMDDDLSTSDDSFAFAVRDSSQNEIRQQCILQPWQLHRFYIEGYLQIHDIIDHRAVEDCIKRLNHYMGTPGAVVAGGLQRGLGKLAGSVTNAMEVRNLLVRPGNRGISIVDIVETMFGSPHSLDLTQVNAQIAFRFPEIDLAADFVTTPVLDTSDWHTDGYRQGKEHPFSVLVGVSLSDVDNDFCGNLLVWPQSHHHLHSCKVGEEGKFDMTKLYQTFGQDNSDMKRLPSLGEPVQIRCQKGDAILLHPDLAHGGGSNYFSSEIRRMVYFRLMHKADCTCRCKFSLPNEDSAEVLNHTMNTADSEDLDLPKLTCCGICQCSCSHKLRSWDDVITKHRLNMWADLSGVEKATKSLTELMRSYTT